jgi:hypothetical protein
MKIIDDPQELQRIMVVRNRMVASQLVLFTAVDYKLIAGTLSFLHRVFPDLSVQNREFIELKNEELSRLHFVGYEQVLETATRFMDWLD